GLGHHARVCERQHFRLRGPAERRHHHVERGRDRLDPGRRAHAPQRRTQHFRRRVRRARDRSVRLARAHHHCREVQRMAHPLQRLRARHAPVLPPLEQLGRVAFAPAVPRRVQHDDAVAVPFGRIHRPPQLRRLRAERDDLHDARALEPRDRVDGALVVPFREHDAALQRRRPHRELLEERAHDPRRARAYFACSRARTAGATRSLTSPPSDAISRTSEADRNEYCTSGARNTVSTSGQSCRFISAIWNSYSKSETARSPRMMSGAPWLRANSTSRPANSITSTRGSSANTSRIISTRSSTVKSPCFACVAVCATATMMRSTKRSPRRTMSSWPFVIGSNEPG